MKRVAPVLLVLFLLAGFKKKAMAGHRRSHDDRKQRFEERARAWHRAEHEAWHSADSGGKQETEHEASAD